MPTPKELTVGGKRQAVSIEEAEAVLKRFQEHVAASDDIVVEKIDVSCKQWSIDAIEVLRPFLEKIASTVKVIDLADTIAGLETSIGLAVMEKWTECFANAKEVKAINLDDNAMGPRALKKIAPLLKAPKLEEVHFNNCGLSAECIPELNEALKLDDTGLGVGRLKVLTLDKNMIGVEGARQMGLLLPDCKNLQKFSYCGCRPESDGTKHIATGLRGMAENNQNHQLAVLKLEDCTFGSGEEEDDAVHDLTKALEKLSNILHLNIRDGDIGETGMGMLAQSLINAGCKIVYLDLAACSLGPDGAENLQELIKSNLTTLKILKLETNEMENDGVEKVLSAFNDENNVLTQLWLDENELSEDVVDTILSCKLPKLRRLSLKDNMDLEEVENDRKDAIRKQFADAKVYFDEDDDEGDNEEEQDTEVDDLAAAMAGLQT